MKQNGRPWAVRLKALTKAQGRSTSKCLKSSPGSWFCKEGVLRVVSGTYGGARLVPTTAGWSLVSSETPREVTQEAPQAGGTPASGRGAPVGTHSVGISARTGSSSAHRRRWIGVGPSPSGATAGRGPGLLKRRFGALGAKPLTRKPPALRAPPANTPVLFSSISEGHMPPVHVAKSSRTTPRTLRLMHRNPETFEEHSPVPPPFVGGGARGTLGPCLRPQPPYSRQGTKFCL